jgi:hypothetical protein
MGDRGVNGSTPTCHARIRLLNHFKKFQNFKSSSIVADDVKTGDLVVGVERAMERRFKVEAKLFFFSTKASQLRLEERRKGFLGLILVDLRGATWLAATVEEASWSPALADFVRSSSEGRKSLSVRGGCNKGEGSWRWWFSWTTIGRGSFGFPRLVLGGVGGGL